MMAAARILACVLVLFSVADGGLLTAAESLLADDVEGSSLCLLQRELKVVSVQPAYGGLMPHWSKSAQDPGKDTTATDLQEYQDRWRSISCCTVLFGGVTLCLIVLMLLNWQSHQGCQMAVRGASSNIIAVFVAKLVFSAICLFTAASLEAGDFQASFFEDLLVKSASWDMLSVSLIRAAIVYALVQGLMYTLCNCCYNEKAVMCVSSVGAPLIGFAVVDACATRLRFEDCSQDLLQYILVAVFAALSLAVLLALHAVCFNWNSFSQSFYGALTGAGRAGAQEHYGHDCLDIENMSLGLVVGFLVFKIVERVLVGEQPQLSTSHNAHEIEWLLLMSFIFAGLTLMVAATRMQMSSMWSSYCDIHRRAFDWLEACCLMSAVWCVCGVLSWTSISGIFKRPLLQSGTTGAALFTAFAASVIVLVLALASGIWIGRMGNNQGSSNRFSYWVFSSALGLLGGLAWADCFVDAAHELAHFFPAHKRLAEGLLCTALAIFVLPAWLRFILPPRRLAVDEATDKAFSEAAKVNAPSWVRR